MKIKFSIKQLIKENFLFNKINFVSRFGCYNFSYALRLNKKFMVVKLNFLVISLKKVVIITSKVSKFKGIFLTYVSKFCVKEYEQLFIGTDDLFLIDHIGYGYDRNTAEDENLLLTTKFLKRKKFLKYFFYPNNERENFYIILSNGFLGFISNFYKVYIKHLFRKEGKKKFTDYSRSILPNLVFITKNSYNEYYSIFRVFLKKRILSIKTFSLVEEVHINTGYNLSVNDCFKVFNICKNIYKINYIYNRRK